MNNRSRRLACNAAALGVWWMLALIGCGSEDETETSSTPLTIHQACEQGDLDALRVLLEDGVDVDLNDPDGLTPLHHASMHRQIDIVNHLLDRQADVHAQIPSTKFTPLHLAALIGDAEITRALLEYGADVSAPAIDGSTPLHRAQGVEVAKVLVDAGADVNLSDKLGATPLWLAEESYQDDVAAFLLSRGAVQHETPAIVTAATQEHAIAQVERLLEGGADIDAVDIQGYSALLRAADYGDQHVVALLIEHGADPNIAAKGGLLALHFAVARGNAVLVRILLDAGADPDLETEMDVTPRAHLQHLLEVEAFASEDRYHVTERVLNDHG